MDDAAPASSNNLLDYPSCTPIAIIIKALGNGHWRVAVSSLFSVLGRIPPVLAIRIFENANDGDFLVRIKPANFWTTFTFLMIFFVCLPLARPTAAFRLPRPIHSLSDLLCFCYASRMFDDKILDKPAFSVQDPTDERVHLESRIRLAKQKYQFGLYLGKDGRRHLGFDVAERQISSGQLVSVDKLDPGRALYLGPGILWRKRNSATSRWFFRKPRVIRKHE